ncbi:MAG: Tad domain-containing protein [Chloroflexi bacterium]|nr:Tad domain-containing protein [Chloroflexota bacterium]
MRRRCPGRDSANDSERGQSLVIIVLLMFGMIAFLGLVIDGGGVFMDRRRAQDASDGAAYAGARQLALRPDDSAASERAVWNNVVDYAKANGVASASDVTATFLDGSGTDICQINQNCFGVPTDPLATGVRVTTTLDLQLYFISLIIGKQPIPVSAIAAVQSGPPAVATNLMPMTLKWPCDTYDPNNPDNCPKLTYGVPYVLMGSPQLPGGFQWTSYDCASSSQDIFQYLTLQKPRTAVMADQSDTYYNPLNPTQYNTPPPSPNPWICSGPGVQPDSSISTALDCWINLASGCWQPSWGPEPPDNTWTVPVYDQNNGQTGSNAMYHTVMFAEFKLLGYWFGNNQCNWVGKTGAQSCNPNQPDLQTYAPELYTCATTQDPNAPPGQKMKCIMGMFLKKVTDLQIFAGKCNTIGINICGMSLSQ